MRASAKAIVIAILSLAVVACDSRKSSSPPAGQRVVIYTSVDRQISRKIIDDFEKQTGIKVDYQTDTEATKSVGLAERVEAEKDNPQADVWWGNEPFHTINLARRGLLAPYQSPNATDIPARYKDPGHLWASSGLRVRVIARTTAEPGAAKVAAIKSIHDLKDPALKGKITMAMPFAGTTTGHMAAYYTLWGRDAFEQFLRDLNANDLRLVGGNGPVADNVGQGTLWAGLTDNDDVTAMQRNGGKLEMILPDQAEGGIGTLAVPTTVGLIAGAKNPEPAKKLIDYILSKEIEQRMVAEKFAHLTARDTSGQTGIKTMNVDYNKVAENMKETVAITRKMLGQ